VPPARRHEKLGPGQPSGLATEDVYCQKVQALLGNIQTFKISQAIGVTWAYASDVRKGKKLPHPQHWQKLAELVGVSAGC